MRIKKLFDKTCIFFDEIHFLEGSFHKDIDNSPIKLLDPQSDSSP